MFCQHDGRQPDDADVPDVYHDAEAIRADLKATHAGNAYDRDFPKRECTISPAKQCAPGLLWLPPCAALFSMNVLRAAAGRLSGACQALAR